MVLKAQYIACNTLESKRFASWRTQDTWGKKIVKQHKKNDN